MRDESNLPNSPPEAHEEAPAPHPEHRPTHIVGIGASAGGLEALERLFEKMPQQTGLAFVVLQHLSPDFKSLTNELLARRTRIPIYQVEDGMVVEPDAIYLLPPKKDMIVAGGRLLLSDKDPNQVVTLPIDYFFRSLAQDAGERAVAVVPSGTGSDGSRGIRDVHGAGGFVVAQDPESAKFDGMPKSAIKTGVVDVEAAPEDIPQELLKYIKHPLGAPEAPPQEAPAEGMGAVFQLLRDAYDIDFSHYKPTTVTRRTERRLFMTGAATLDQYVEALRRDPGELNALYKDLLIGVTRFFRDREAFDALAQHVLPALLQQLPADGEFRAWVAGCATGEEAYSLAILVAEQMELRHKRAPVRIFATDVHRHSLEVASAGVYPEASLADVSPQRLQRFFTRKGDGYVVTPELRKMVVFAQHDVINDAPFTKLDLVACRNLLIYFQPAAQKKVLSLFHFALRTGGALFLGPSESPGELEGEFEALDPHWHVYRKRRDVRLPAELRVNSVRLADGAVVPAPGPAAPGVPEGHLIGAYDALLDAFMPPSVLVTEDRQVIRTFAGAQRYLRVKGGRFSNDVLDLVDAELRMALTGALPRALKEMRPMVYKGLRVGLPDGGERLVNLTVRPLEDRRAHAVHALVSLEDTGPVASAPPPEEVALGDASREHVQSLENELRYTKENLQATVEELETANEELQATNEELVASNEELQSTNEELHSVNEELYTVNAEYQRKIAELTELTADMDNLLASTDVHTIFLDRKLCIRKFTPRIAETFNLLPQDVGRRIDNFTHTIGHPGLLDDLRAVLETAAPVERQVRDHAGRHYLMRVLPYRGGGTTDGVVLTLVDITNLRRAQAEVNRVHQQLTSILRNSPSLVSIKDLDGRYLIAGDAFRRLVGRDDVDGKTAFDLFPAETARALTEQDERVRAEGKVIETEVTLPHADGPHTYLSVKFPLRDEEGHITAVGGIQTDVTPLKQAESSAQEAVRQRDRFLAMLSHELRNPLTATVNHLALLDRRGPLPAEAEKCVQVIRRRVRHMARLLDDLLDVARIAQNKIGVRKQLLDLAETADGALEEVRDIFAERKVELTAEPAAGPLPVMGDPARLQQIQVNLLLNAAKYTPAGGRAWYAVRREGDEVVIRVRDSGAGLAPGLREHCFDLFVQGDGHLDRAGGGMGVGLSLVKSIVALHGGRVQAYSDGPGRGSEFVVWLPLAREPLPSPPSGAKANGGAGERKGTRLLVVEDDDDNRDSLKTLLELNGFQVTAVADGPAALEALKQARADIAVIDLGLPGMSGCEVARQIRGRYGRDGIRLAALTGYGQASDREQTQAAGFDVHLTKPLEPDELFRVLYAMKDGRVLAPEARS